MTVIIYVSNLPEFIPISHVLSSILNKIKELYLLNLDINQFLKKVKPFQA